MIESQNEKNKRINEKITALKALEQEMEAADLPLKGSANLVFGEGNVDATVLFIGEAPGFNEDVQRRPFVGRGGQLLNAQIEAIGWKRADVYITNIVKRRPPENRDPLPEEIEAYKPFLARQIDIISPKIIVTLGRFSMNYFLPLAKITRDQGRAILLKEKNDPKNDPKNDRIIYPVFHPAAALRNPEMMKGFVESFKKLPSVVSGDFGIENAKEIDTSGGSGKKKCPRFRRII
jgi:DNA polymerase